MKIKRIAQHHKQNCTYCKLEGIKTQALHRMTLSNLTACAQHIDKLREALEQRRKLDSREYSEGDWQSWLKL